MSENYKKPFIPIWMDQAGFTPHQFRILAHFWSRGEGRCFPSLETIAKCCGMKRITVINAIKELELRGFVTRRKRKSKGIRFGNEYVLSGPKGAPDKNEPVQKGHRVTGPNEAPGNRSISSTGNDTSGNDSSLNRTKETKETGFSTEKPVCDFSSPSKESQLAELSIPKKRSYPTEDEFEAYVETAELDQIVNGRPYLWDDLENHKWHHWNEKRSRWEPIKDWRRYIEALDITMQEACGG